MNKSTFLLGAAVALVVLIDLATGQGPPVYTQYIQAQQQAYPPPPPQPIALHPVGPYAHRAAEFEPKKLDKEVYEKELAKEGGKAQHKQHQLKKHQDKSEHEKSGKGGEYKDKEDGRLYEDEEYKSTPAPGVLSSFSNSMSGAWSRISNLGRSTRSVEAPANATIAEAKPVAGGEQAKPSRARGMESYELLHQKSNGYIYFKVPKHLVCNQY